MATLVHFDVRCPSCKAEYHTDNRCIGRWIHCRCGADVAVEQPPARVPAVREQPPETIECNPETQAGRERLHYVGAVYGVGYWITFALLFVGFWIYCVAAYGFLIGVMLGWIPSVIAAGIVSLFWPLLLVGVIALLVFLSR